MPDNIVNKAMSNEEMALVSNIESVLGELKALQAAQGEQPPMVEPETAQMQEGAPPVAEPVPPEDKKEKEEKTKMTLVVKAFQAVAKELVDTPSDGPTGSDDAEAQIMDVLTDVTEDNLQQVTKNITSIIRTQKAQKSVAATAPANNNLVLKALGNITDVIKANQERQAVIEKALSGILEGMGVVDQLDVINKSVAAAPVADANVNKSGQPIVGNQNQDVLTFLQQLGANFNKSSDAAVAGPYGAHVERQNSIKKTLSDEGFISGLIGRSK